ncbi:MAG: hypothetical protein ACI92Z_003838, partial [Paracoccaceae bacterium]
GKTPYQSPDSAKQDPIWDKSRSWNGKTPKAEKQRHKTRNQMRFHTASAESAENSPLQMSETAPFTILLLLQWWQRCVQHRHHAANRSKRLCRDPKFLHDRSTLRLQFRPPGSCRAFSCQSTKQLIVLYFGSCWCQSAECVMLSAPRLDENGLF